MRPDMRRRQDALEKAFEIITSKAAPFSKVFEDCFDVSGKQHGVVADLVATQFKAKTPTAFEEFPEIKPAIAQAHIYSTVGPLRVGRARVKSFEGDTPEECLEKFAHWFKEVAAEKLAFSRHKLKGVPKL